MLALSVIPLTTSEDTLATPAQNLFGVSMNAHAEVVKLLDQLRDRAKVFSPKAQAEFNAATDSIEVLTRGYMVPKVDVDWADYGTTPIERRFLDVLNRNFGRTVAYHQLDDAVYYDKDLPEAKSANVHICKIRAKLLRTECPYMIETDWGIGYKLVRKEDWQRSQDRGIRRTGGIYAALEALKAA